MQSTLRSRVAAVAASLAIGFALGTVVQPLAGYAQGGNRVFEIRTYTAHPGKLDAVNARFRNHTTKLFQKHGMTNIAYWTPTDSPLAETTLIYVISHASRESAKQSWAAFVKDPDWVKVKAESEAQGPIVAKIESVFMQANDYSPLK
jgi:hypothetical protein